MACLSIQAFAGFRPTPIHLSTMVAPPYDVVTLAEAKQWVADKPYNFLRLSRPEVAWQDPGAVTTAVNYDVSRKHLQQWLAQGILQQDSAPCLYVLAMETAGHRQIGVIAAVPAEAYSTGLIKVHEFTRPDKEQDRVLHLQCLQAHTSPVLLAYRQQPDLAKKLIALSAAAPTAEVQVEETRHQLWAVSEPGAIAVLLTHLAAMPALYVADGHHRIAAAAQVAQQGGPQTFLAALFPDETLRIHGYHRLISCLADLSLPELLQQLAEDFTVTDSVSAVQSPTPGSFGMYVAGKWFTLTCRKTGGRAYREELDAALLTRLVLAPRFGVEDIRRDRRLQFVGGPHGVAQLQSAVDNGTMAVGFTLAPPSMTQLLAVADSGAVMPPKSTWFAPKLLDGLVSMLD